MKRNFWLWLALGAAVVMLAVWLSTAGAGSSPLSGVAAARSFTSQQPPLVKTGATWAYDYSATPPASTRRLQWIPQVWGAKQLTAQTIAALTADRRSGRTRYLLTFNEPDNPDQAAMSPTQVAALWPKLEQTGLELASPAPQQATDGWLTAFMAIARARHLRVNFIALHYYQDFTNPGAVGALKEELIGIHNQFHRPIWITEIGTLDERIWGQQMMRAPTQALALIYMRQVFQMLHGLSFVKRVAWFTDACTSACRYSSLFDSGGRLSALGRVYRSLN